MPYFVFRGLDGPEGMAIRARVRPTHQAFLAAPHASGTRCVAGGPLLADATGDMIGTLLVLSAPDRPAAEAFLRDDPYTSAGLFAETQVHVWGWGIGRPMTEEGIR